MYKYFGVLLFLVFLISGVLFFLNGTPDDPESAGSESGSQHKSMVIDNNLIQQDRVAGQSVNKGASMPQRIETAAPVQAENANVLSGDERKQLGEKITAIENKTATIITDYDNNLSDVEKRKEIEGQFANESKDFKRIALKLAKDQIASEKPEENRR